MCLVLCSGALFFAQNGKEDAFRLYTVLEVLQENDKRRTLPELQ